MGQIELFNHLTVCKQKINTKKNYSCEEYLKPFDHIQTNELWLVQNTTNRPFVYKLYI